MITLQLQLEIGKDVHDMRTKEKTMYAKVWLVWDLSEAIISLSSCLNFVTDKFFYNLQMNSLTSLLKVCDHLPDETNSLSPYEAQRFKFQTPNGKLVADVGCEPILHMRHFQVTFSLPNHFLSLLGSP